MTGIVLQLPTAVSLATIDVARLTDSSTYARGVEYLRSGRVHITRRTPDSISATVTGTQPYAARVAIHRRAVDFRCSCPVGADGAFCKHLVALALVAAGDAAAPEDADENATTDLRSWLATLERAELIDLLASAADDDDELREHLARRRRAGAASAIAQPIDLTAHREAIAARLAAGRDDAGSCCWADQAHEVVDEVESLLARGHAADVRAFCEFAVNCLETSAPDIFDGQEDLVGLAARLGELHRRACLVVPPEPIALADRLFASEMHDSLGAFEGAAERYATLLGAEGLAEYRRLADTAWKGTNGRSTIARTLDRYRLQPIIRALDQRSTRGG